MLAELFCLTAVMADFATRKAVHERGFTRQFVDLIAAHAGNP
jgi:hypothetical protein